MSAKRVLSAVLCLVIVVAGLPFFVSAEQSTSAGAGYGLSVDSSGNMLLNGQVFRAIGVNYFDPFVSSVRGNVPISEIESEFKQLHDDGITFARVAMCGFYPNEVARHATLPDWYFEKMDIVVEMAEKYEIGIIANLFWCFFAIPDIVEEDVSQLGNENSETAGMAKQYAETIVNRYKSSPAIWGWEIGNEYNLEADLFTSGTHIPDYNTLYFAGVEGARTPRTVADLLTADDFNAFNGYVGAVIRENDPNRLITGGESEPRPFAYNMYKNKNLNMDTPTQMGIMMNKYCPAPLDTMSVHFYQDFSEQAIEDFDTQMSNYMAQSSLYGKALFVGEFGVYRDTYTDQNKATQVFENQLAAILKYNVPLASIWVYGKDGDPMDMGESAPDNRDQYDAIIAANQTWIQGGFQNTADYWNSAEKMFEDKSTLYDGDAEISQDGCSTWGTLGAASVYTDTTVLRGGNPSLKINIPAGDNAIQDMQKPLPDIAVSAGETIKLSGYIKVDSVTSVSGARLVLRAKTSAGAGSDFDFIVTESYSADTDWIYIEKIVTASQNITLYNLIYTVQWSTGEFWFQGFKIERLDPNLFYDGALERSLAGSTTWAYPQENSTFGVDNSVTHLGQPSLTITVPTETGNAIRDVTMPLSPSLVSAGDKIKVSGYIKATVASSTAGAAAILTARPAGGGAAFNFVTCGYYAATADWTYFENTVVASQNLELVSLIHTIQWSTGSFWFQSVKAERLDPNVLYNRDAEISQAGCGTWGTLPEATVATDKTTLHNGLPSVKINIPGDINAIQDLNKPLPDIAVDEGDTIKLSGYIKTNVLSSGGGASIILNAKPTGGSASAFITCGTYSSTTDWTYFEQTAVAPQDLELTSLLHTVQWSTGAFWFQGVKVEKVVAGGTEAIVYDGQAETDQTGCLLWGTREVPATGTDTVVFRNPDKSLKTHIPGSAPSIQDLNFPLVNKSINAGDKVKLSGYVKTTGSSLVGQACVLYAEKGDQSAVSFQTPYVSAADDWTYTEVIFVAQEALSLTRLSYTVQYGTGSFWFDGFKIEVEHAINEITLTAQSMYTLDNGYLTGIESGTTLAELKANLKRIDILGFDDVVGTGSEIALTIGGVVVDTVILVVTGDLDGDGIVNADDLIVCKKKILFNGAWEDHTFKAGDLAADEEITVADLVVMKKMIVQP